MYIHAVLGGGGLSVAFSCIIMAEHQSEMSWQATVAPGAVATLVLLWRLMAAAWKWRSLYIWSWILKYVIFLK
jgi:hypothetical protein